MKSMWRHIQRKCAQEAVEESDMIKHAMKNLDTFFENRQKGDQLVMLVSSWR